MMAAFGVAMIAGILLLAVWHPDPYRRRLDCIARAFEAEPPASSGVQRGRDRTGPVGAPSSRAYRESRITARKGR